MTTTPLWPQSRLQPADVFAQFPAEVLYGHGRSGGRKISREVDQRVKEVAEAAENAGCDRMNEVPGVGLVRDVGGMEDRPVVFVHAEEKRKRALNEVKEPKPSGATDIVSSVGALDHIAPVSALLHFSQLPLVEPKTTIKSETKLAASLPAAFSCTKKHAPTRTSCAACSWGNSLPNQKKAHGGQRWSQEELASLERSAEVAQKAKTAMLSGDLEAAFRCLADAVDSGVKHADVFYLFGEVSRLRGLFEQAEKFLTKALCFKVHSPYTYYSLGLLYIETKRCSLAVDSLQRFVSLAPTADGHFQLGRALELEGEHEAAIRAVSEAIRLAPKCAAYYLHRGRIYATQKNSMLAKLNFRQALESDPKFLVPYYNEYEKLKAKGETKKATEIREFILEIKDAASYHL